MERCFSGPKARANEIQTFKKSLLAVFAYCQKKMPCYENNCLKPIWDDGIEKISTRQLYFLWNGFFALRILLRILLEKKWAPFRICWFDGDEKNMRKCLRQGHFFWNYFFNHEIRFCFSQELSRWTFFGLKYFKLMSVKFSRMSWSSPCLSNKGERLEILNGFSSLKCVELTQVLI